MKILLREVMIEKDITYQELAKRSGVSTVSYTHLTLPTSDLV